MTGKDYSRGSHAHQLCDSCGPALHPPQQLASSTRWRSKAGPRPLGCWPPLHAGGQRLARGHKTAGLLYMLDVRGWPEVTRLLASSTCWRSEASPRPLGCWPLLLLARQRALSAQMCCHAKQMCAALLT